MQKMVSYNELYEFYTFKKYIYKNYNLFLLTEEIQLNELSGWLKDIMTFITDLANMLKVKISELVKLFMNSKVYQFFNKIKWNINYVFELVKKGYKAYKQLLDTIAEFISKTKVVKWTEEKLKQLDTFLIKHPTIKHISGIVVAGLLLYIWFKMSFTGDFDSDFDINSLLLALAGKFSLSQLFSGKEGVKLLLLFATGILGVSFPWPGHSSIKFVGALIYSLTKSIHKKIKGVKPNLKEIVSNYKLVDVENVPYELRYPSKNTIIKLNIDKVLKRIQTDDPNYAITSRNSPNIISQSRIDNAKDYWINYGEDQRWINPKLNKRTGLPVMKFNPSIISIYDNKLGFTDGRHRLIAMKELGYKYAMYEIPKNQIKLFNELK